MPAKYGYTEVYEAVAKSIRSNRATGVSEEAIWDMAEKHVNALETFGLADHKVCEDVWYDIQEDL